jgi:hypothetical protein
MKEAAPPLQRKNRFQHSNRLKKQLQRKYYNICRNFFQGAVAQKNLKGIYHEY